VLGDNQEMRLRLAFDDSPVEAAKKRIASNLNQMARGFQGMANQVTSYLARVGPRLDAIAQKAEKMSSGLRAAGLAMTFVVTTGIAGFLGMAARAQSSYETNQVAFETMIGSAQGAIKHLRELEEFATNTPFENQELIDLSRYIQVVGFNAQEVLPILENFGNLAAAAGGGDKLGRIITQIGQIRSNMRATGEDMRTLAMAGVDVWGILSDQIGEAIPVLRQKISDGVIDGARVIDALMQGAAERYGGLMDRISKTTSGKFSNLKDKLFLLGKDIGQILDPYTKRALDALDKLLAKAQQLVEAFKGLPSKTKDDIIALIAALAAIGPALLLVAGGAKAFAVLAGAIRPLIAAGAMLAKWWGTIAEVFGLLFEGGLGTALAFNVIRTAALALLKPLAILASALLALAVGYVLVRHWREVLNLLMAIFNDLYRLSGSVGKAIVQAFGLVAKTIYAVWRATFGLLYDMISWWVKIVVDALKKVWDFMAKIGQAIGKWFGENFTETQIAWKELKDAVVGGFKSIDESATVAGQGTKKTGDELNDAAGKAEKLAKALKDSQAALFEASIAQKPQIVQELERMRQLLAQLRKDGVLTSEVLTNYLKTWELRLKAFWSDATKEAKAAAIEQADAWRQMQDEQRTKDLLRVQAFRDETLRIEVDGLQEQLDRQQTLLEQQRQAELASLEGMRTDTVEAKLVQINAKLGIERKYLQAKLILDQEEMKRVYEAAQFELEIKAQLYADDVKMLEAINARKLALQANYQARMKALADDTTAAIALATQNSANAATAAVNEHQQSVFNSLKQQAGGIFDAFVQKSESVWSAIANSFKTAMLTAIKDVVTSQIAFSLMRLLYGTGASGVQNKGGGGLLAPLGSGGMVASFSGVLGGLFGGRASGAPDGSAARPFYVVGAGGGATLSGLGGGLTGNGGLLSLGIPGLGLPGATGATPGFAGGGGAADILGGQGGGLSGILGGKLPTGGLLGKGAIGGQLGSGLVLGGATLAMLGLQRGGVSGTLMAGAGGALIGAKFGGPIGAAIGAAAGIGAGLIRGLFKGSTDKVREAVQRVYGVRMSDKGMLQQIADMAKQSFGGNIDAAVRSSEVRKLVELYALSTGQRMGIDAGSVNSVSLLQSNGQIYQALQYAQGRSYTVESSLATRGTPSQVVGASPNGITLQLDGQATVALLRGEVATGIRTNSRAVANSQYAAAQSNIGRRESLAASLSPGTLIA